MINVHQPADVTQIFTGVSLSSPFLPAALLGGAALFASPAKADLIFNLTPDNVGGTGPYVQVDVNRTSSSTATITFDALANGGNTYYLMDGGSVALNINGAFTLGSITGTAAPLATSGELCQWRRRERRRVWQLQLQRQ
jgi:hypothetical protein